MSSIVVPILRGLPVLPYPRLRSLRHRRHLDNDPRATPAHAILLLCLPQSALPDSAYFQVPQDLPSPHYHDSPASAPICLFGWKKSLVFSMTDISSQFNGLPVEEQLRECSPGCLKVVLWVLEELVEKVISDSPMKLVLPMLR